VIKRTALILSLFILLSCNFIQAQNPFIKLYTTEDGLPSNSILIISSDRDGFLWIATRGGLVRYDGSSFKQFVPGDGLSQNKVMVIKEDSFGRLWLFCIGRTLNYYYHNKIYNNKNARFLDSLSGNWNFTQDRHGNLYFYAYQSRRITVLDTNDHVKEYRLPSEPTGDNNTITNDSMNIQYMVRAPSDEYMIWTNSGIYKTRDLSENPMKMKGFDREHYTLGLGKLAMFDVIPYPETNSSLIIKFIDGSPVDTSYFYDTALEADVCIIEDSGGNLWISSPAKGLYCMKNNRTIYHMDIKGFEWLCEDHEGNIWVTSNDGAYKISPYVLSFKHFDNSYFQNERIGALSADPEGGIWGLHGSTIFLYRDNEFYSRDVSYLSNTFRNIDALNHNTLLIYDYDYNSKCYAITGINADIPRKKLLIEKEFPFQWNFNVAGPEFNKNRDMVCIHNIVNQFVTTYSADDNFKEIDRVPINKAHHVFYDARDKLVVLEPQKHYILQSGKKIPYKEFTGLSSSLPLDHLTLDSSADVFLSMFDSLYLVKNREVYNLTSSFDYSFNTPFKRMTYQSPVLYLSTSRNIYACDKPLNIRKNTPVPLRLIDINFSYIIDILANNDSLYIASKDGLTIIPTDLIDSIKTKIPSPYLKSIHLNDHEADPYSGGISVTGKNKINFEFSSINYSDNPALFSYMLEGYDKEWNTGTTKSVAYANLDRGNYTFKLRAGKTNSPWSDPKEFDIKVKATFWQHPLFYIILSVIIAALISMIVIYRKNLQLKKIEREHQLVTLEQKALQSMMNPHFLFNALGSIQHYLLQNKPSEAGLYLSQFARLVRQNIHGINSPMLSLEAETDRLKNYLDLEKMRMKNRFDYSFEIDEDIMDDALLIPSMIIQPFVENSILHGISPLEKGGMITISFSMVSDKAIRIVIEDNGVGINQSKAFKSDSPGHLHLSMEMTKKRIEILGKKYNVPTSLEVTEAFPSSSNPGTRVTIVLPVSYGEDE
jgi:sugar lactone lactonase YvrE